MFPFDDVIMRYWSDTTYHLVNYCSQVIAEQLSDTQSCSGGFRCFTFKARIYRWFSTINPQKKTCLRYQVETFYALCAGNSPVSSSHKGQWRGALMLSLIFAWPNGWVNKHDADDLRRHHADYGVTVMERYYRWWCPRLYCSCHNALLQCVGDAKLTNSIVVSTKTTRKLRNNNKW